MRQMPDQTDQRAALPDDAALVVALDADEVRPRRMTPAHKKAIEYLRDRRYVAEDPHRERRSWPKRKALRNQTFRRQVDRAIRPALGEVTPEFEDFAPSFPYRKKSNLHFRHGTLSLGAWVHRKLERRLGTVGSNIPAKLNYPRYRRRLIPFLE